MALDKPKTIAMLALVAVICGNAGLASQQEKAQRETAPKPSGKERFFSARYMASLVTGGLCGRGNALPVSFSSGTPTHIVPPTLIGVGEAGLTRIEKELDHD